MEMTARGLLLAAALLAAPLAAAAASFDCAKAGTPVERMVCADPGVSALDERVADAYKAACARDPRVKESQREWLAGTRNKCGSTACLSQAYTARLEALGQAGPACAVAAAQLVGHWLNVADTADPFEEADFTSDKGEQAFVSFVHHAPFITGTWTLQDCKLHIAGSGDRTDFDYAVTGLAKGRLSLKDDSDGSAVVLRKAK
jgi:uncharacterized protein